MKIPINEVIVVEGKYDKIKLDSIVDADVITLDGFGIFKSEEKKALIRKAAESRGVIVLTDSDSAGMVIRNHVKSITGGRGVINLYTPTVLGKEKRKDTSSKEGILGVEGIDPDVLRALFEEYKARAPRSAEITKRDLYEDGFVGKSDSKKARDKLIEKLDLPRSMSTNALLSALNMILTKKEYKEICEEIK